MELQQFITTTIKAIGKGIEEGKTENIVTSNPWVGKIDQKGVEFELLVDAEKDGKIQVRDYPGKDVTLATRIKFVIPITIV